MTYLHRWAVFSDAEEIQERGGREEEEEEL
jgi:hypothetical protein